MRDTLSSVVRDLSFAGALVCGLLPAGFRGPEDSVRADDPRLPPAGAVARPPAAPKQPASTKKEQQLTSEQRIQLLDKIVGITSNQDATVDSRINAAIAGIKKYQDSLRNDPAPPLSELEHAKTIFVSRLNVTQHSGVEWKPRSKEFIADTLFPVYELLIAKLGAATEAPDAKETTQRTAICESLRNDLLWSSAHNEPVISYCAGQSYGRTDSPECVLESSLQIGTSTAKLPLVAGVFSQIESTINAIIPTLSLDSWGALCPESSKSYRTVRAFCRIMNALGKSAELESYCPPTQIKGIRGWYTAVKEQGLLKACFERPLDLFLREGISAADLPLYHQSRAVAWVGLSSDLSHFATAAPEALDRYRSLVDCSLCDMRLSPENRRILYASLVALPPTPGADPWICSVLEREFRRPELRSLEELDLYGRTLAALLTSRWASAASEKNPGAPGALAAKIFKLTGMSSDEKEPKIPPQPFVFDKETGSPLESLAQELISAGVHGRMSRNSSLLIGSGRAERAETRARAFIACCGFAAELRDIFIENQRFERAKFHESISIGKISPRLLHRDALTSSGVVSCFPFQPSYGEAIRIQRGCVELEEAMRSGLVRMQTAHLDSTGLGRCAAALLILESARGETIGESDEVRKTTLSELHERFPGVGVSLFRGRYASKIDETRYFPPACVAKTAQPFVDMHFYTRYSLYTVKYGKEPDDVIKSGKTDEEIETLSYTFAAAQDLQCRLRLIKDMMTFDSGEANVFLRGEVRTVSRLRSAHELLTAGDLFGTLFPQEIFGDHDPAKTLEILDEMSGKNAVQIEKTRAKLDAFVQKHRR